MAERLISKRVRLLPNLTSEPAASDPVPVAEEESLASLAALSNLPLTDRGVTVFVQSFTNQTLANLQGATA